MTVSRIKVRLPTKFPAAVQVTAPLTIDRTGGNYTFGLNAALGAAGPAGEGYGGTSTTSLAIATGSKSFTITSGLAYRAGNYIRASSAADGTNYMEGTITSYSGTALVLNVTKIGGSGTKADWTFSTAGTPGANGAGSGDLLAANNGSDFSNKKTTLDNLSVHGADVASATTTNLETATGDLVDVTGTTTITAITLNDGHERTVRFTGALILTHGASLVLPAAASITTAAGDFAVFRGYAAGVVRCVGYTLASGKSLVGVNNTGTPTSGDIAVYSGATGSIITSAGYNANQVTGLAPSTSTFTVTIASPGVFTWNSHGLSANATIYFTTTSALPTGLTASTAAANPTVYFVIGSSITTNTFQVATTLANAKAGTAVNTSGSQSGTHTAVANAVVPPGCIGEYIWKELSYANRVAMTNASIANSIIQSLSVSAGIWSVAGNHGFETTGGGVATEYHNEISTTGSGSLITAPNAGGTQGTHLTYLANQGQIFPNGPIQIIATGTTTIYHKSYSTFSGSQTMYGFVGARRIG